MTYLINEDNVIGLLEQVVKGNEDKVYEPYAQSEDRAPAYRYTHGDVPGCIVGHVVALAAPQLYEAMKTEEDFDQSAIGSIGALALRVEEYARGTITDKARNILRDAQRSQDKGDKWAEALLAAKGKK